MCFELSWGEKKETGTYRVVIILKKGSAGKTSVLNNWEKFIKQYRHSLRNVWTFKLLGLKRQFIHFYKMLKFKIFYFLRGIE